MIHVYLLEKCPYSQSLARILRKKNVKKTWVRRGSPAFYEYKQRYDHPTYPIVVVEKHDQSVTIGGYTEFMNYLQ